MHAHVRLLLACVSMQRPFHVQLAASQKGTTDQEPRTEQHTYQIKELNGNLKPNIFNRMA